MRLLKNGLVQIHMPRTGGKSLAKQYGVAKLEGSLHDGPEMIPAEWRKFKTVTTVRPKEEWEESMYNYLRKIEKPFQAFLFNFFEPKNLPEEGFDPTFKLWPDPEGSFYRFGIENADSKSWYELYSRYFTDPADIKIPIGDLKVKDFR